MSFTPAQLDAMLERTGKPVVFSTGVPVFGKYREGEVLAVDDNGYSVAGTRTTVLIRDGAQPAGLKEDDRLTVGGVPMIVRGTGFARPDGFRALDLQVA